jgi:Resolvase, N terminal domain
MPVYGYCRVSADRQANEGESLGVQERQLQGYVTMQGMKLDRVFVERGVSGSIPLADRPEGAALLATLQSGDVVVSPKLVSRSRSTGAPSATATTARRYSPTRPRRSASPWSSMCRPTPRPASSGSRTDSKHQIGPTVCVLRIDLGASWTLLRFDRHVTFWHDSSVQFVHPHYQ